MRSALILAGLIVLSLVIAALALHASGEVVMISAACAISASILFGLALVIASKLGMR